VWAIFDSRTRVQEGNLPDILPGCILLEWETYHDIAGKATLLFAACSSSLLGEALHHAADFERVAVRENAHPAQFFA
jgi:hypothetical protein